MIKSLGRLKIRHSIHSTKPQLKKKKKTEKSRYKRTDDARCASRDFIQMNYNFIVALYRDICVENKKKTIKASTLRDYTLAGVKIIFLVQ